MGQVKSSGCIKQRGLIDCQLKFLVCFTRITKRGTMLSHLHPVETMTGPILRQICCQLPSIYL